jgi:hypothetical protein
MDPGSLMLGERRITNRWTGAAESVNVVMRDE